MLLFSWFSTLEPLEMVVCIEVALVVVMFYLQPAYTAYVYGMSPWKWLLWTLLLTPVVTFVMVLCRARAAEERMWRRLFREE